ncbi:MAG: Cytochrome bo(3) ubiquinol oxidase subunit 4 [Chlamydiae bacterium]|nr:Cytochrome bo(3) ubiquinol oxidase subunit 4 [Chlamydiota bacterium]
MIDPRHGWNVSFKPLYLGFVLSIILIAAAYRIVVHYHLTNTVLTFTILSLAALQVFIQLYFFLHIGMGAKPRWHLISFFFMVLVIIIVVGGSMWIMQNLKYNVMPTEGT